MAKTGVKKDNKTLDIKTVCECCHCLGSKTLHPQVSLINLEKPELEEDAVKQGIRHIIAEISSENEQSMSFHASQGFIHAGRLKNIGFKLGRTFDIIYMQKEIK